MRLFITRLLVIRVFIIITLFLSGSISHFSYGFEEDQCKVVWEKTCVDFGKKIIDGFSATRCWKYEERSKCISKEQNNCKVFEEARSCSALSVICREDTEFGCGDFEKKFTCGSKHEVHDNIKLIDERFYTLRDEKDLAGCSLEEINKSCEILEKTCAEGPATRNINGKNVYKDCWAWNRQYKCRSDTYIDECKELASSKGCKEVSKECLHATALHKNAGRCEHYEK